MFKALASKVMMKVVLAARECMGGNGILLESHAIKSLMDIQTMITGEGTYEMNVLVAGRELTSLQAFV